MVERNQILSLYARILLSFSIASSHGFSKPMRGKLRFAIGHASLAQRSGALKDAQRTQSHSKGAASLRYCARLSRATYHQKLTYKWLRYSEPLNASCLELVAFALLVLDVRIAL